MKLNKPLFLECIKICAVTFIFLLGIEIFLYITYCFVGLEVITDSDLIKSFRVLIVENTIVATLVGVTFKEID